MSYSIHYGPNDKDHPVWYRRKRMIIGAVLSIIVLVAFLGWWYPDKLEAFALELFPWTRPEVRSAFLRLQDGMREGKTLSEAVTAFCVEIIHGAN
jgi:hypothetical protein